MRGTTLTAYVFLLAWSSVGPVAAQDDLDRSFQRAEIRRHDNGRLAYYHWPAAGPSLLLIPGSWGVYQQYDAVRSYLDQDVNLVIVELPGHGQSWPPTLEGSIESFARDVLRVTDVLGWKSWYAGGHSIGGMIAIELAAQRPERIAGVISIEGWTHHQVLAEAFSGRLYETLSASQEQQRQLARQKTLNRFSNEQRASFVSIWTRWDGEPILRTTPVRVLEVWGDRNEPLPDRQAMRIPDRKNVRLHWIKGASHALPLERPAQVAAAINRFIQTREDRP